MKSSFLFRCARVHLAILLLLFSSGCSMYKNRSECPLQSTISCQPASKINELINENKLEDFTRQQNCKDKACRSERAVSKEERVISKNGEWAEVYFNSYVDDFGARRGSHEIEFPISR